MILLGRRWDGGISVFLAFILLLILALVGTTLEGTRLIYAKTFSGKNLSLAVDTILTKYYLPLYEEYHVFFLDTGIDDNDLEQMEIKSQISDSLNYVLNPQKDSSNQSVDIMQMDLVELKVLCKPLIENKTVFLDQVLLYMSQKESIRGKEDSKADTSLMVEDLRDQKVNYEIISHKLEVEQYIAETYESVLTVIQLIEGIDYSKNGLRYDKNGSLKVTKSFAKKICIGDVSQENVSIKQNKIWVSLKHNYVDLIHEYQKIQKLVLELFDTEWGGNVFDIANRQKQINELIVNTREKTQLALESIEELEKENRNIEVLIQEHEKLVKNAGKQLKDSLYQNLLSDVNSLKEYHRNYILLILDMKPILQLNLSILEHIILSDPDNLFTSIENLKAYDEELERNIAMMKDYNIKDLVFDYGILVYQGKTKDPAENLEKMIGNHILSLLTDQTISTNRLDDSDRLNSGQSSMPKWNEIVDKAVMIIENIVSNSNYTKEQLSNKNKFYQYLTEHFNIFTNQSFDSHTLNYEMEYFLQRKDNDHDNLMLMVNQLMAVRTLLNFTYLLGDHVRSEQAYALATILVGCTGMEPLIRITKTILCLVWAYEEALVDVSGLLNNKSVPIIKSANTFQMVYQDLFAMNKDLIKQKVQKLPTKDQSNLGYSYEDYIKVFHMFQNMHVLITSVLELIQTNLSNKYDPNFSIERCIYGITAEASFHMEPKFLLLPFVKNQNLGYENGWKLYTNIECSY